MSGIILSYTQTRHPTGLAVLFVKVTKIVLLTTAPSVVNKLDGAIGNY